MSYELIEAELKDSLGEITLNRPPVNVLNIAMMDEINDVLKAWVGKKYEQRWRRHAIAHRSGNVLAAVFGRCQEEVCLKLQPRLEPFGMTRY